MDRKGVGRINTPTSLAFHPLISSGGLSLDEPRRKPDDEEATTTVATSLIKQGGERERVDMRSHLGVRSRASPGLDHEHSCSLYNRC